MCESSIYSIEIIYVNLFSRNYLCKIYLAHVVNNAILETHTVRFDPSSIPDGDFRTVCPPFIVSNYLDSYKFLGIFSIYKANKYLAIVVLISFITILVCEG